MQGTEDELTNETEGETPNGSTTLPMVPVAVRFIINKIVAVKSIFEALSTAVGPDNILGLQDYGGGCFEALIASKEQAEFLLSEGFFFQGAKICTKIYKDDSDWIRIRDEFQNVSEQSEEPASSRSSSRNSSASKRSTPGPLPQHRYSRDKLVQLAKCPLSLKIPDFLEATYFNTTSGKWDPEKWFVNKRGDKVNVSEETRLKRDRQDVDIPISLSHKRRTSDPRERIKEEKDEIILSPQRRSFGTGCHVIQQPSYSKRPGSPTDARDENYREPTRRIGSGRMLNRDRDWDREHREYYNSNRNDRDRRTDRFDQDDNEKDSRRYSAGRYDRRGRNMRGHERIEEEEPEWFSGGPTSQSETIELVGFEETSNENDTKKVNSRKHKRSREWAARKQNLKNEEPVEKEKEKPPTPVEKPVDKESPPPEPVKTKTPSPVPQELSNGIEEPKSAVSNFGLDDLFKMAWLIPKDSPPESSNNEIGCSRFSQWFQRESPPAPTMETSENNSRRSSLHDEFLANMLSGTDTTSLAKSIEADLKRIVLGDGTNAGDLSSNNDNSAFNRLVQVINDNTSSISMGPIDRSKALQEEELLQNILGQRPASPIQPPRTEHDKFPNSTTNITDAHPNHMQQQIDIYNKFLQHHQRQDQQQLEIQAKHFQQQLLMQQQQAAHLNKQQGMNQQSIPIDTFAKLLESQPAPSASPVAALGMPPNFFFSHFDRQNINSLQQQQRQRELLTLLKQDQQQKPNHSLLQPQKCSNAKDILITSGTQTLGLPTNLAPGISPRQSPLSQDALHVQGRIPSPLVFGQQPPALSHAPAPIHPNHLSQMANANTLHVQGPMVLQRGPSPQELAVHTQAILQTALIKRKLEEQKENFRKRQEAQRANSPNMNNKGGMSTSPLKGLSPTVAAFTPTSVMRKMHTEKMDNCASKAEILQNGGNKITSTTDNDQSNAKPVSTMAGIEGSFATGTRNDGINKNGSGQANPVPRALFGQNLMSQSRSSQQNINSNAGMPSVPSQGRAIVKGNNSNSSGMNIPADPVRMPSANSLKQTLIQNKLLQSRNEKTSGMHMDRTDSSFNAEMKFIEQQLRLLQQQQKSMALFGQQQRRQNSSPMPAVHTATAAAAAFAFGPRNHGINPNVNANIIRPIVPPAAIPGATNLSYPMYRAAVIPTNPSVTAMRATPMTQFQLAALQMQRASAPETRSGQSGGRSFHPMAFQQLLNANQAAAAQAQNVVAAANIGGHGDGKHLMPGKTSNQRQSPVNLSKWFGSEVLQQKMPELPLESHEKALRLEDIERQPQHSATVHN